MTDSEKIKKFIQKTRKSMANLEASMTEGSLMQAKLSNCFREVNYAFDDKFFIIMNTTPLK